MEISIYTDVHVIFLLILFFSLSIRQAIESLYLHNTSVPFTVHDRDINPFSSAATQLESIIYCHLSLIFPSIYIPKKDSKQDPFLESNRDSNEPLAWQSRSCLKYVMLCLRRMALKGKCEAILLLEELIRHVLRIIKLESIKLEHRSIRTNSVNVSKCFYFIFLFFSFIFFSLFFLKFDFIGKYENMKM